tara:strand:+ start:1515 stop:2354 length:840 start_codon:yes stop_codon:yes gene_type:complete
MLNNLQKRVITAFLIYPIIIFIILYSNEIIIRLFLNIIIFIASFEISKMCFYQRTEEKSNRKHYYFIASIFISIFISNILIKNNIWHVLIFPTFIIWLLIPLYFTKLQKIDYINNFNIFYFLIFLLLISSFYCSLYTLYLYSSKALIYLITIVSIGDIAAYFVGRKYGKKPFFNNISPNKTLEGFLSSLFVCLSASLFFCLFENYDFIFTLKILIITLFVTIMSAFGDLSVSLIKRYSGKKDTGNILPGHGGILDRVDSLISAAPVFLIFSYFLSAIIK